MVLTYFYCCALQNYNTTTYTTTAHNHDVVIIRNPDNCELDALDPASVSVNFTHNPPPTPEYIIPKMDADTFYVAMLMPIL